MFVTIYDFFAPRRGWALLIFGLSFALAIVLACRLRFAEDINSMLPQSPELKAMNNVMARTQAGGQLVFLASLKSKEPNQDSLIELVNAYAQGLQQHCAQWIDTIRLQAGSGVEEELASIFMNRMPLLLTPADYRLLDTLTRPERIQQTLAENKKVLMSPAGIVYKRLVASDPLGLSRNLWSRLSELRFDPGFEVYEGYIFSTNGLQLSFFVRPRYDASQTGKNSRFMAQLNAYSDSFAKSHPQFQFSYFGAAAVAAGNATQMRTDTLVTLSVTVLLLMVLSLYYFRRKRTPLLLLLPVAYGAAIGLAVMYLVQGSMSVIALGAGAIVMGIAIDYSIHFLSHRRHSGDLRESIRELQMPLTVGSFTTIAAFLSLRFVQLPLLRDLGLFAAVALIGAAVCTLVFLPHFPLGAIPPSRGRKTIFDRLARIQLAKSKPLLWGIVLLTPLMAWFGFRVQFDDNLMHLNYLSPRLEQAQQELSKASAYALSSVFVITTGTTDDAALQELEKAGPLIDSLRHAGAIRAASNPTMLLPSEATQNQRVARWITYWSLAKRDSVMKAIRLAAQEEGYSAHAFDAFEASLSSPPVSFDSSELNLLKGLFPGGFAQGDAGQHHAIAALKVPASHRAEVFRIFHQKLPELSVHDRQQGASALVRLLNTDFQSIALYSSFIVFFALLIVYGRIELALISFLPMAISWVWILGLMAMLGIKFNIVNIIISTLIFGLGDDYSIFTLDGLMSRYKYGRDHTEGVRASVYVSVTTVLIGLGALLLARHPALRGIAAISITGMLCVLLVSQTLQPALFQALIQHRADKGQHPFSAWSLLKSSFAFLYFVVFSLLIGLVGFVLVKLRPFGKERGRLMLHQLIRRGNWSLLYIMGNVQKHVYDRRLTDFSRPAVYVANHASFLDILQATSINPKLVLLTNKWVFRSPVFGSIVRMAEYYPVAEGAESSLEPLRDLVRRGYSIFVFPEGTRSSTDKIGRFHKGAFFIAESLKLDIVPVLLHGSHYTMSKGDWLLKDGQLNMYFHERVSEENPSMGKGYSERSLQFARWFRRRLDEVKVQKEHPSYFREQLLRCFCYKGPVLEWYCRIKSKMEGNYESLHDLLPREGSIYDLGCGYGFASFMLYWSAPKRQIRAVDYDEEKISVAQATHLRGENLQFEVADLRTFQPGPADAIIISDALHYLLPDEQQKLLSRCVEALPAGGILIVRDGVVELKERQKRTALTELFSTKILRFNKATNKLHFISRREMEHFARMQNLSLEIQDESRHTSNLRFVMRKPFPDAP
ncbi:MAG: 1-acyl-sn-glycerol-3-phosphate acyltransferase [Bacteroidetes bacterium]|nr:1-acyl-sn-glycerol-3-phosphate acyltransferase [Bacteroidota bacterium]